MQAYVARKVVDRIFDMYTDTTVGYIVDKVELLKIVKTFDPATGELLSVIWKVKFVHYNYDNNIFVGEVDRIFPLEHEADCQRVVDNMNKDLDSMRRECNYSNEELKELKDYLKEYQQLARESWGKDHTL